jgi:sterol 3beta-glucosyltransferase
MRIAIHTLGTRGDVQPYVALALGLRAAGHEVSIAAPEQFSGFVAGHGLGFAPLPRAFLDLMETPEGKAVLSTSKGFSAGLKLMKQIRPIMRGLFDAEWAAASRFRPDLMVFHPKAIATPHIAEKLGCRTILASPLPGFTPTAAFPSPMLPFASLGPLNRISHGLAISGADALYGKLIRIWRREALGLPERAPGGLARPVATLYAYSPSVVPRPLDWGPDVLVSGYWFLDGDLNWSPEPDLAAFLAAGPPPVYVGFGSMPVADAAQFTATIVEALRKIGQRGVVAAGWGQLGGMQTSRHVQFIDGAPHDKLFPMMAAVVHHGGAGTTAAGLRAGKPTVICPFFGDQPFWGRRVEVLGAGPSPIARQELTADRLAAAIDQAVTTPAMRVRAEALGAAIRAERGVEAAVAFIEENASLGPAAPAA